MSGDFGRSGRGAGRAGAGRAGPRPSRRTLLAGGAALGGLALGAPLALPRSAFAQSHTAHTGHGEAPLGRLDTPAPPMDQPLVEPEVRRSKNGVLSTTLRAAYGWRDVGGFRLFLRGYEGGSPGPTLRLEPGDTLRVRLVNDLPPNLDEMPADISHPHLFNTTNFHFHGGHVSPSGIADNVMRTMPPGGVYDIAIDLPDDHTAGTYWYHPHHHGSADIQMASGMRRRDRRRGRLRRGAGDRRRRASACWCSARRCSTQRGTVEDFERAVPRDGDCASSR
jgi:FtsP/CotA-like multicopper oxidase with cupredoxin domain